MIKSRDRRRNCVFDFKQSSVLAARIDFSPDPKIHDFFRVPANEISPLNAPDIFADFIKTVDKKSGARVVAVWDEDMNCRQIVLPNLPEQDLKKALVSELKNLHAVDDQEHLVQFEFVRDIENAEGVKEKLFNAFYCKKKPAMQKLELIQNLGFHIDALIPGPIAAAAFASSQADPVFVADIGRYSLRFLIVQDGKIVMARQAPLGGSTLTEAITAVFLNDGKETQYGTEEAEALKVREGVSDPQAAHIALARAHLEKIVAEIKRCLDFYQRQKYAQPVSKVLFTGGGSNLKGLQTFMAQFLGMEVLPLDPERHLSSRMQAAAKEFVRGNFGSYSSLIGASLADDDSVNLLPHEIRHERFERAKKISARMVFAFCLIGLIFFSGWMTMRIHFAQLQLKSVESEWKETSRMNELLSAIVEQQRFRISALKGDVFHAGLLKQLGVITPNLVVLDHTVFNRQSESLMLRGTVHTGRQDSVKIAADFMKALLSSPFIRNVTLTHSAQTPEGDKTLFEITCSTKGIK